MVKNLPAVWETWVRSQGQGDPLEKGTATCSSGLAWRIPWTEETGGLQSMGSQRVRHDWANNTHTHTHTLQGRDPFLLLLVLLPPSPVKRSLSQQMNKRIQETLGGIQWEPGKNFFFFFGPKACGILPPWTGIEAVLLASEDKVLTTGPPDNSHGKNIKRSCTLKILACSPWGFKRDKICCCHLAYHLRHDGAGASLQATHPVSGRTSSSPQLSIQVTISTWHRTQKSSSNETKTFDLGSC